MYKFIFGTVGFVFFLLFRFVFRWRISGLENIPPDGAVLAANHQSFWDIPLIALSVRRRVHFMAKEELFQVPVFGAAIRAVLAFPVKRGAPDRAAIRHAIEKLQEGDLVVIFPEGTRSKTGKMGKFEPGAALIAMKAGVPMVPTGIIGTDRILRKGSYFSRIEIHFGQPVPTVPAVNGEGKKTLEEIGLAVRSSLEKILNRIS